MERIKLLIKTLLKLENVQLQKIIESADLLSNTLLNGGTVFWCGNGGSAAQALHLSTELIVKYKNTRKPYPSIALNADVSLLTAAGNDFGFEEVFVRQIEGLGKENDLLVALSTSGKSPNVLKAIHKAKEKEMKVIFLTGQEPTEVENIVDIVIHVPSKDTPIIQECHQIIGHIIIEEAEKLLEGDEK